MIAISSIPRVVRVNVVTLAGVFLIGSGLCMVPATQAQGTPPNVLLNTDGTTFLQNEEQIWINVTDPLNVIANWRDWRLGFRRVGLAVSIDGGANWGTDSLLVGRYSRQSDPCLTGDRLGNFYMNVLDYDPSAESQISVFRSTDKGVSWGPPVAASGSSLSWFEDKQFTAVDRTGGLWDGNYYVSWTRFPNTTPSQIMFVRSTTGAQGFWPPVLVGAQQSGPCGTFTAGQGSIPMVNSDGSVHVFWSGFDAHVTCRDAILHVVSVNGGASFSPLTVAFPSNAYFERVDGGVDVYGFPIADADITGGPRDGTIYIAHTQFVTGFSGETDVQVRKSIDNGTTWTEPQIVNDDTPGQNIDQFHPWLAVNQDGVIVLIFYDQRHDPINHLLFDCYFTASFDGAETFTHNSRISSVSINPNFLALAATAGREIAPTERLDPAVALSPQAGAIAEYIGVHAIHDQVVAVWTDTRNGNQDVFSAEFEIPFAPPRLYAPVDGTVMQSGLPDFVWSTCWHEIQDSYRLELSTDSAFGSLDYSFAGLTESQFVPPSPLATGFYYWRVKAFRTAGDSTEYSEIFTLSPSCQGGAPPTLLAPAESDTLDVAAVACQWSLVPDALSYSFQLSNTPDFASPLVDSTLTGTEVVLSGLADSTTYYWRVSSTNTCTTGAWNDGEFRVEVCPVTLAGDVNIDGLVTAGDIVYLVTYVFKGGPEPLPIQEAGDVNCDGEAVAADIIYLVNHVFRSGPAPCDICALL